MRTPNRIATIAMVAIVFLAGCGAGVDLPGTAGGDGGSPVETATPGATGTLAFYVSDQPTAIDDFESLTVTITEIGVHRSGAGDGDDETEDSTETTTESTATGTDDSTETTTESTETETSETETEDDDGDAGWTTHPVDNETVDLTELQGANAVKIADIELPAGEYNGVTLTVSNVTGTLTTGETVAVKLPSERLRLNKGFTLGAGESTSFVFDIAVHEAGGSGKYVLRPVIGQSGADVPITDVGSAPDGTETEEPTETEAGGGPPQNAQGQGGGPPTTDAPTTAAESTSAG